MFFRLPDLRAARASQRGSLMLSALIGAVSVCLVLVSAQPQLHASHDAVWLIVVAVLANMAVVLWDRDSLDIDTASGFIPLVLAAVTYGPVVTIVVAAASSMPYLTTPSRLFRCLATRAFSGAVISCAFSASEISISSQGTFLLAVLIAAIAYQLIQLWVTTAVLTVERGGDAVHRLRTLGPHFGIALLLFGPMVVAFAYLMSVEPPAVLLASIPAAFSHQLLVTVARSRSFERLLSEMGAEIPGALLAALDAADAYTAQHSASVASYSFDIARACGYDDRRARQVHAAALLHDVGKIGVPDSVLTKATRLDDQEWDLMKRHPEMGANIVRRLPGFHVLEGGILHHHERLNGTGYPNGLAGEDIPLEAQIIAVADTYSAITTTRSYRQAKTPEYGIDELRKDATAGKLNAKLVELFVGLLAHADDSYRTGRHTALKQEVRRVRGWQQFDDTNLSVSSDES